MSQPTPITPTTPTKIRKPPVRRALGIDPPTIQILDIGAMPEGADRYAGLLEQELAEVVGFEPNPEQYKRLVAQRLPHKRYLPYFLGKGGPATFHVTRYHGCCSLYEPDPAIINLFMAIGTTEEDDNFRVVQKVPVQTVRLDDVTELPAADFLKLDIQGGELDVLENATRVLSQATVLEVEAEFVPMYKHQPLFGDIQTFLRRHNFLLHKLIDVGGRTFRPLQYGENRYEPMSQLLFADAIFVRDFSDLAPWSDAQLLKAAAMLYEMYNSHDLVLRLLTAYDQRRGTASAVTFTNTLRHMPAIPTQFLNPKLHV